jgi:hypothetical protein
MLENDRYTYRVTWSEEDEEYVGLCAEFPSFLGERLQTQQMGNLYAVVEVFPIRWHSHRVRLSKPSRCSEEAACNQFNQLTVLRGRLICRRSLSKTRRVLSSNCTSTAVTSSAILS